MKKAIILTADKFEDMEVMYPLFRLQEAGWQVDVAAPKIEEIHGEFGYGQLMSDITIKKAQEITKSFFAKNKPVASICHGPWTLADTGVIKGRRLTSYWHDGVPESVKEAGGKWEDKDVVVDGNLVTSRWPADLPAFMREVMKLILNSTR